MRIPEQICHLISRDIFFFFLFFFFLARRRRTDAVKQILSICFDRRTIDARPHGRIRNRVVNFTCEEGPLQRCSLAPHRRKSPLSSLWRAKKKKKRKKRARREGGRERERAFVAFANRIRRQVLVHISRGELRTLFSGWRSFRGHRYRMVRTRGSSNRDGFSLFNGVRCFPFV